MQVLTQDSIAQVSGGWVEQCSGGSFADAAIGGAALGAIGGGFVGMGFFSIPGALAGGVGGFTGALVIQSGICLFHAI